MSTQADVRVTFRVEKDLKESAERLFKRLGLNMSTALNVFLRKAVEEEAIPFSVSVKSAVFGAGNTADEITSAFIAAVDAEIEKNQNNGYPIARYDAERGQAYLEVAEGVKDYV